MIRRLLLLLLVLVAGGFVGGMYVGFIRTRPRPSEPAATRAPAALPSPRAPDARRTEPAAPAPAERPARRAAAPRTEAAPAPAAPAPAAATVGLLTIDTDVPGAQVFVDRQFVGAAPVKSYEVAPGSHRINVSAPGYEGVAETIDVEPGPQDVLIKLREVRLSASIDVVHKHRMGSCTGRLVATPQGIRYETSDRDDVFNSALVDLETLEVDYLKKNLKVKIRKGRTFDFTDPQGNADHLFVFHRDVANARDRLKKGDPPASP